MRDVMANKLRMLLTEMLNSEIDSRFPQELAAIIREEKEHGFQDGDRDLKDNVIIYTLSPDAMPDDIKSDIDFTVICTNVAGSPDVIRAVNEAITDAAEFQRGGGLHPVPTTNRNYIIKTDPEDDIRLSDPTPIQSAYDFTAAERRAAEMFEREIETLTGKKYPVDFSNQFVSAKAACDQAFLDQLAFDSMQASDEIENRPRAEYIYKQCKERGGLTEVFSRYIWVEVVCAIS
jgi:uncharacterized protein YihD (DUF1040 family)